MLKNKLLAAMGGEATDDNFENVTLLLHGDGTNGGQNNTFVDGSTNNFTITRNGNTTQGSFSPYGDLWSNYVTGSTGYLSIANNSNLNISNSDFTFECWINAASFAATENVLFSRWGTSGNFGYFFSYHPTNGLTLIYSTNGTSGGNVARAYGGTITPGVWTHVAFCRSGGSTRAFINGQQVGSTTSDNAIFYNSTASQIIGGVIDGTTFFYPYTGYISNIRLVIGTAQYTSNFTPSTTPLTAITNTRLLTCQSNRFIDNSSNNFTITRNGDVSVQRFSPFAPSAAYSAAMIGGSGYFDGTGDYLTAPSNAAFTIGTGDFRISLWAYFNSTASNMSLVDMRNGTGGAIGIELYLNTGTIRFYTGGADRIIGQTLTTSQWYFIELSRVSGTTRLFVNGSQTGSSYADTNSYIANSPRIAVFSDNLSAGLLNGYLSDVRIVNGSGVSSSTTPTAPLTAITNTSLLLNFTNAAIFDNAMMNDLETVGNAQISTSVKKYGTGSLAFDGSGDYLFGPMTPNLDLGSGDFTIEMWVYFSSLPTSTAEAFFVYGGSGVARYGLIYDRRVGQPQGLRFTALNSSNALVIDVAQGGSSGWSSTTWYHVAVTRSGNSFRLFRDGVQIGSTVTDTDAVPAVTSGGIHVAIDSDKSSIPFDGYIDDLRITKGVARYTANFTAPTAPFPSK